MRGPSSVLLLSLVGVGAAACGKTNKLVDGATGGDGRGADAASSSDAAIDASPAGVVTVTVLDLAGGPPVANVPVVFINPGGAVVAEPLTGSDGKASATVLPGASVTAIYGATTSTHNLETILGVKPGDDLTIGSPAQDNGSAGAMTVNITADPGATAYTVYGPCGGGNYTAPAGSGSGSGPTGGTDLLDVQNWCKQTPFDLLAVSTVNGGSTRYVSMPSTPFVDGTTIDLATNWAPMPTVTTTITNVATADVSSIGITERVPDGLSYGLGTAATMGSGATVTATASMLMPAASRAFFDTSFYGVTGASQDVYEVVAGAPTTYGFDAGATLLPWLGTPTLDPATAKITAPMTGSGTGDVFRVRVDYNRFNVAADTTYSYSWNVRGPTAGDLTLPTMPTDLADNNPAAGDSVTYTESQLVDVDGLGYDQLRANLYAGVIAYYRGRTAVGRFRDSVSPSLRFRLAGPGGARQPWTRWTHRAAAR